MSAALIGHIKPAEWRRDPYEIEFEIDGLPPINSADGTHWRKRQKLRKDWENRVWIMTTNRKPGAPLARARVTITRFSARQPDFENLAQGGKFLLDGLVKVGVLVDDKPAVIGQPVYLWEKYPAKLGKVRIRVEAIHGEGV